MADAIPTVVKQHSEAAPRGRALRLKDEAARGRHGAAT